MERYTKSLTTNTYLLIVNILAIVLFLSLTAYDPKYAIFGMKLLYSTTAILVYILTDRFILTDVNTLEEILGIYNHEEKYYEKLPNLAFSGMLIALALLIALPISSL